MGCWVTEGVGFAGVDCCCLFVVGAGTRCNVPFFLVCVEVGCVLGELLDGRFNSRWFCAAVSL